MNQFGNQEFGQQAAPQGGGDNNKTMKMVGIGCTVLLILSCCCASPFLVGGAGIGAIFAGGPKSSTDAWLDECRAGNFQQAFQRMNGPYQASHNVQSFQAAVQALPVVTTFSDRTMNSININNNMGTVSGTLTGPSGAASIEFRATNAGGNWYIDTVLVNGVPLQ